MTERACRVCGCTQNNACVTNAAPCHWVEHDLCSACVETTADERPSGRRWLPCEWLDEMNPTLLESPDRFIERAGEAWALRLPEGDEDRDNEFYQMTIELGQIVQFLWTEHYGDRILTILPDRTWTISSAAPQEATHFFEYSSGALADSLEELVKGDTDVGEVLEPGDYEVAAYKWSEPVNFRFEVDADGAGRFAPSAGAN